MPGWRPLRYLDRRGSLRVIDQRALPARLRYRDLHTPGAVAAALKDLTIRGAPLIGVAAAYGVALAARRGGPAAARRAIRLLRRTRPTAVNLQHALLRMERRLETCPRHSYPALLAEARRIEREDRAACLAIARRGIPLVREGSRIMVYCNAGALATAGIGTALGILHLAHRRGRRFEVIACETRPLLQGARLTAWELTREGISTTVICDNMAAAFMPQIDMVFTGADRIAANGDVANKIGTRGLAIVARYHRVPFYVAAPLTTLDLHADSGREIPIEQRDQHELRRCHGRIMIPKRSAVGNPAFDVTPAHLISGIITERGIARPPYSKSLRCLQDG